MEPDRQLIAPCGMYCGVCSSYLAYSHQTPRVRGRITYCAGCRPRNKQCSFLKKRCARLMDGAVEYCFECPSYPCERLQGIDTNYRRDYGMSLIENLDTIRAQGEDELLTVLEKRFACSECGELRSVHSGRCYTCDDIKGWKD
jgi:hypothetical protein